MGTAQVIDVAKADLIEDTQQTAQTSTEAATAPAESNKVTIELDLDSIPEKFRKDPTKVFDSYEQAEAELGRQRNVAGTYRSLVDELSQIKRGSDLAETQATEPPTITSDELLEDPSKAISTLIEEALERRLAPIENAQQLSAEEQALAQFQADFPSFSEDITTEEFKAFVNRRPSRQRDAQLAAQENSIEAARRLMENYEDYKELNAQSEKSNPPAATKTPTGVAGAKAVATETPGAGGAAEGKKIFTHREVVKLITEDPETYRSPAYQKELVEAMKDGRYRK